MAEVTRPAPSADGSPSGMAVFRLTATGHFHEAVDRKGLPLLCLWTRKASAGVAVNGRFLGSRLLPFHCHSRASCSSKMAAEHHLIETISTRNGPGDGSKLGRERKTTGTHLVGFKRPAPSTVSYSESLKKTESIKTKTEIMIRKTIKTNIEIRIRRKGHFGRDYARGNPANCIKS